MTIRAFWIALAVGITAWCVMTHQPWYWCAVNVGVDVWAILVFIHDVNQGER